MLHLLIFVILCGLCTGVKLEIPLIILTFWIYLIILILLEVQMNQNNRGETLSGEGCCSIESVVSVDERGQMVLPKEIRERADIQGGDKLALIGWEKDGRICCITIIKAEELGGMVKGLLKPMMRDLGT